MNLKVGTWNVRTMLDINTDGENARPHRRTALIALELERFNVDIAALSETRLSGEGSLTEVGGGYTFFWRGYPEGQPRKHGVGLAIRTTIADKLTETPVYISERLMTLRVPLVKGQYVTILSCYAPTLVSDEDQKDVFYEQLHHALSEVRKEDKIILLGDFNAQVGTDANIWGDVIKNPWPSAKSKTITSSLIIMLNRSQQLDVQWVH